MWGHLWAHQEDVHQVNMTTSTEVSAPAEVLSCSGVHKWQLQNAPTFKHMKIKCIHFGVFRCVNTTPGREAISNEFREAAVAGDACSAVQMLTAWQMFYRTLVPTNVRCWTSEPNRRVSHWSKMRHVSWGRILKATIPPPWCETLMMSYRNYLLMAVFFPTLWVVLEFLNTLLYEIC